MSPGTQMAPLRISPLCGQPYCGSGFAGHPTRNDVRSHRHLVSTCSFLAMTVWMVDLYSRAGDPRQQLGLDRALVHALKWSLPYIWFFLPVSQRRLNGHCTTVVVTQQIHLALVCSTKYGHTLPT